MDNEAYRRLDRGFVDQAVGRLGPVFGEFAELAVVADYREIELVEIVFQKESRDTIGISGPQ
ncbi:hypothetical protein AMJ96_PD00303 (plasmid) [Rhizobium sp. N113]|nr:hypothetical protein AMJ96_PD00303 [Rhizobium sp. N113]